MRPVHKELAEPVARGLLGAASVDGGPTEEQAHIIGAFLHGYFDVDTDVSRSSRSTRPDWRLPSRTRRRVIGWSSS
jgi:hypothetical protein